MKKNFRLPILSLLCLAFIFTTGCSAENNKDNSGQNPDIFTHISQEIIPIEENPFTLPMEISSDLGLHKLDVQRPNMNELNNSDDVVNAILASANQVANIKSKALAENVYLETGERPVNQSLSDEGEYFRAYIQIDENEQENGEELWGDLYLDAVADHFFGRGGMQDSSNSAILIKYRKNLENTGYNFNYSNSNISTGVNIDDFGELHFWSFDEQRQYGYTVDNTRADYINSFQPVNNEWYYTLVAMDENLGYRFLTWQENNPVNHAYYAINLSAIFFADDKTQGQHIWSSMNFYSQANESSLDIESIAVYTFENFNDIENADLHENPGTFAYSNDDEKYQLAVQFFEAEDYYNAYTLLQELDGYDSSTTYLVECERLLKTVEIENPYIAGKIKKAMKEKGMPFAEHLYVYQAEKIESLDLSECLIDDLDFISSFSNLKELNLDKNAISDLTPLKDLYSLESLSLAKNNISDILPLSNLGKLKVLDLSDNLLEDVSDLGNLSALKEVNLSTNNINTIDGLSNLEHLESVDLSYNYIYSVSALENSPIKELNIMNTNINNLSAVANLPELETLTTGFRYIWKGNESYLLTRKYEMDHHFFLGITGLEALAGHKNLKKLNISRLEATNTNLEPLTTIPNLESLIFHHYTGQADPESLAKLVNLKELTLDSFLYGFGDTSFLSSLTKLEKLSIETFCTVDDLSVISGLPNLEELRMYKYGEDLSFLTGLKNLRLLELINWDTVDDYSPLLTLDNLEYLALQEMTVNDLSVIAQLDNLKYLRLDSPEINNIKDVGQLENLEYFLMQNAGVIGDSEPEFFDRSLFNELDHLKFAAISVRGENGFGYEFGDPEFEEIIEEPPDKGIEEPEYDYYWIDNLDSLNHLSEFTGSHHLVIDGFFSNIGESIKLTIPKNIRNLYIFSYDDQSIKIELDGADNKGLERIVVGHIDVSSDDPDGFGQGNFIIENLDGLSGCTNLKEVYINAAKVNDISGLADCDKLEIVEMKDNNISDISALADKRYLRELSLSGNNIESIEALNNCLRLQSLSMQGNPVSNYDSIEHLPLLNW